MNSAPRRGRLPATVLGVVALVVAGAGGAFAAGTGGTTIRVCVHHKGGGLYQAKKCARHDPTLRWNVQGPPGNNGSPGANGAVAGFSANSLGPTEFTSAISGPITILSKQLPGGSFIINAKTALVAGAPSAGLADDYCELSDGSTSDAALWSSPLEFEAGVYVAYGTVSMDIAVSANAPSTVTLSCGVNGTPPSGFRISANSSQITAIQTSSNS